MKEPEKEGVSVLVNCIVARLLTVLRRGFTVEQVQDWVDHSNIQNTIIYSQVSHSSSRQEMGKALADWK